MDTKFTPNPSGYANPHFPSQEVTMAVIILILSYALEGWITQDSQDTL